MEEAIEKVTRIVSDKQNSIEVSKLSKGYTWSVKIYFNPGDMEDTLNKIKAIEKELKETYGSKEEA